MKKYIPTGRELTAYEREILTILIEECGEVVQAGTKLLRFGANDEPYRSGINHTNSEHLALECGDVMAMITRVAQSGLIKHNMIARGVHRKEDRLTRYLQTEPTMREEQADAS